MKRILSDLLMAPRQIADKRHDERPETPPCLEKHRRRQQPRQQPSRFDSQQKQPQRADQYRPFPKPAQVVPQIQPLAHHIGHLHHGQGFDSQFLTEEGALNQQFRFALCQVFGQFGHNGNGK